MDKEVVRRKYQGMTLVELLIALLLGAMISSIMFNAFYFIKKCVLTQQALIRMQANARYIDYLLGKALRNSGGLGCQRLQPTLLILAEPGISLIDYGLTHSRGLRGVLPTDLPLTLGASKRVLERAVGHSDMLWLQTAEPLSQNHRSIKQGTLFMNGDCQRVNIYRWQEQSHQQPSINVQRVSSTVYYIGKTKRTNEKGIPIYALYSTDFNGRTLELVEGVTLLEFTYGSFHKDQIVYQKASDVRDWFAVVSVRLKALLNGIEDNDPKVEKWWSFEWVLSN